MPRQRIDYTSLREWRKEHGLTISRMAEIARRRGAPISPNTLGKAFREGRPINGNVLFAWEAAFGWSRQETLHLCMGGDPVRVN